MWKRGSLLRPVRVGIRREDSSRIWERRAPLTPDAVHDLISSAPSCNGEKGIVVDVVSCSKRVFTDAEYERAGASIVPRLSKPNIILGIKETPIPELDQLHPPTNGSYPAPIHLMFSHTIKGQLYNMPLLARFLNGAATNSNSLEHLPRQVNPRVCPTLIDYELLTDENGKRSVGFGWFAGAAGVPEAFSAMAQSHLDEGVASPFLYTARPYTLRTLEDMQKNLQFLGSIINSQGFPDQFGPFIIGVTGRGNVSQGVLDTLKELPITTINVKDLPVLVANPLYNKHTVYLVHVKPEEYLLRDDGQPFDRTHYYANPESYKSEFHERVAPYLTLFINGVGWQPEFPRLMTNNQLTAATYKALSFPGFRFRNIADISCDIKGGLEFMDRATTLTTPFYDISVPLHGTRNAPSLRVMSVDILPAALPIDASKHFSKALLPYLTTLIEQFSHGKRGESSESTENMNGVESGPGALHSALQRATVATDGELTEKHKWLGKLVEKHLISETANQSGVKPAKSAAKHAPKISHSTDGTERQDRRNLTKKNILLLGSGMVSQPVVDYLVCKAGIHVRIASNNAQELKRLEMPYTTAGVVETKLVAFDDPKKYEELVYGADVVISLLPAHMHTTVAATCIAAGKPLVTASYVSREMEKLNLRARQRGVLILTEMGLDPGLDHLSALDLIDTARQGGRHLSSFISMCGGLPAPEDALDVPLKYKFSWRPEGVLTAALQDAQYALLGDVYAVDGQDLLRSKWGGLPIVPGIELEGLPNRDSLAYLKPYRLGGMRTFVRGTLRYPGYSSLLDSFKKLGLLNNTKKILFEGWNTFVLESMSVEYKTRMVPPLAKLIHSENLQALHDALEWLGLANPTLLNGGRPHHQKVMPPLPRNADTPLSVFAYLLSHKLQYQPTDKDMVILSHEIISFDRHRARGSGEVHTSTLVTYGTDQMHAGFHGERSASAMARTVGLPAAIVAMMIAEGKLDGLVGVRRPVDMGLSRPILRELEEMGIRFEEKTRRLREVEEERVGRAFERGTGDNTRTIEASIALSVPGVPEEKRKKLEKGEGAEWVMDMDSFKGWKEEEVVEWPEKVARGR